MATTNKKERRLKAEAALDDFVSEQIESLDEALEKTAAAMRPYEKLKEKRDRILRARDALLGGNRTTGGGGTQLRLERVVEAVKENPGISTQELADNLNVSYDAAYGHVSRRRGDRFLSNNGKTWYLRDPKNGKLSIEDYEEDE